MENDQTHTEREISSNKYQGPGRFVTSAGYVAMSHGLTTVSGILVGGLAAFLAHEHVNGVVGKLRGFGERVGGKRGGFITALFGNPKANNELRGVISCVSEPSKGQLEDLITQSEKGFFEGVAHHVAKWFRKSKRAEKFLEKQSEERLSAMFIGGGVGGVSGWVGSTVWGIAKGTHHGNVGKRQFAHDQEAIKNLQEDNADLNKINDELHEKYVRAATRLDTMQAASEDASRALASAAETTPMEVAAMNESASTHEVPPPKTEVQLDEKMLHGKLGAHAELDAASVA